MQASKNIFWLTLSRGLALLLLFLAYRQLFAYLGPFGSGQYQFVLSYVLIFSTIVDFGVQQFITKKISEDPENTKKYFHNFLTFELVVAVILYVILLLIAFFSHYEKMVFTAIAVVGLGMVANAMTYPFLAVMTAKQDLKKVAFINFLNSLVNISVIFLAVVFQKNIIFLASIQLVFGFLDLILYRIFIVKHLADPGVLKAFFDFDFSIIKNIFKSAWPFALVVGFSAIYNRIDVVIISHLLGYNQTGLYTAAYKFFDLLNFFPASVSHVLFPVLAGFMASGLLVNVRESLEKYLRLMILTALPVAFGAMVLAKPLIMLMTNNDQRYLPAAQVLSILIWAVAILFIYIPVNSLVLSQLTKKAMLVTGVNVLVNSVGNFLLIPHFGLPAAAAMTVVSELIQGFFYFNFVKNNITNFNFWPLFIRPLFSGAVMGLILWPIRAQSLLLSLPIGVAVYFIMIGLTGAVSKRDLIDFKAIFKPSSL